MQREGEKFQFFEGGGRGVEDKFFIISLKRGSAMQEKTFYLSRKGITAVHVEGAGFVGGKKKGEMDPF